MCSVMYILDGKEVQTSGLSKPTALMTANILSCSSALRLATEKNAVICFDFCSFESNKKT